MSRRHTIKSHHAYHNTGYESSSSSSYLSSDEESNEDDLEALDYEYTPEVQKFKSWDVFKQNDDEFKSASEKNQQFVRRGQICLKVFTGCFTFLVVLTGAMVSKGALFFIVSQTAHTGRLLPFCRDEILGVQFGPDEQLYVSYTERTAVAWLWCVYFVFTIPELLSWLRSVRVCLMRSVSRAHWMDIALVAALESLHVVGVSLLFFGALPAMDSTFAVMVTSGAALLPASLRLATGKTFVRPRKKWMEIMFKVFSVMAVIFQVVGLIVWPIVYDSFGFDKGWQLAVGMLLTSFGWWESFVVDDPPKPLASPVKYLHRIKRDMFEKNSRYYVYMFVSLWKLLLFFALFLILPVAFDSVGDVGTLFSEFHHSFQSATYTLSNANGTTTQRLGDVQTDWTNIPGKTLTVQIFCAFLTHAVSKFACRTSLQRVSFALPLSVLTAPSVLFGVGAMCKVRNDDECAYSGGLPPFVFFQCPTEVGGFTIMGEDFGWVWILLFLSEIWISIHVWYPKSQRLASTEQMFGTPYYSGLMLEQSLLYNRRADSGKMKVRLDTKLTAAGRSKKDDAFLTIRSQESIESIKVANGGKRTKLKNKLKLHRPGDSREEGEDYSAKPADEVSRVFGCATMWHESAEEMVEMLKSIFRMDEDWSARFLARKMLGVDDPDYYEWETNIFFDDAFERADDGVGWQVNSFVRLLVHTVDVQGKKWYGGRRMRVPPPARYVTPYGGRLVWILPGGTRIVCHLKDKEKIRHKKRWSQCMYMYYFLGHGLMDNRRLTAEQKALRAHNTFLLALDGDVDFQPDAIIKLIDLMKRNADVGASCGRIHPTGRGYMQWYQMFEYAIGHWLQKSTEHVMGCVLCSPGCFSLFRARAVMDDNVMRTYTTVSTEPRHFVQYDQGEDRWLCTLMLQKGWRVEYSAASDSYTACPEGFKEFYNQRRRWMPSTIANIMDLLSDWKRVVDNNDDISFFYILYQVMMMVGTVLGPGSIFLMLIGAVAIAFSIENWVGLVINLVPLTIYIVVCLTAKSDTQIMVAQLLSVIYALIMMAVLIGLILQMVEDGWLAPTTLSFLFVTGVFVLAGCLHPQEFWCLPMGIIYYVTIPSMYLFLIIYAVFNLHVVSWGTREVPKKKSLEELEAEKKAAEEEAKKPPPKKTGIRGWFQKDRWLQYSMTNMFNGKQGLKGTLDEISRRLDGVERALRREGYEMPRRDLEEEERKKKEQEEMMMKKKREEEEQSKMKRQHTVRIVDPMGWIEDPDLGTGPRRALPRRETKFWIAMIEKYLKPLIKDKEKEEAVGRGLKELRNQMVFSFLMINGLWVVTVFLMQENQDKIYIEWPWGAKGPSISYSENLGQITLVYDYLQLEPIGLVFLLFFAVVLLIQLIGMLIHRVMTLAHILSTTEIRGAYRKRKGYDEKADLQKNGVNIIKDMQRQFQPEFERDDDSLSGAENNATLEDAVEKTLDALATGDSDMIRRFSDASAFGGGGNRLSRAKTLKAVGRAHSARKATMRRRPRRDEITPTPPRRPQHQIPEDSDSSSDDGGGNYGPDGSINLAHAPSLHHGAAHREPPRITFNDEEETYEADPADQRHQSVRRTQTYDDPDGFEEREI